MNYEILTFTATPFGATCTDDLINSMIKRLRAENIKFGFSKTGQYVLVDPADPTQNLVCTSESAFLVSPIAVSVTEEEAMVIKAGYESRIPPTPDMS